MKMWEQEGLLRSWVGKGNIKVISAKQSQFFLKLKKQRHIYPPRPSIFVAQGWRVLPDLRLFEFQPCLPFQVRVPDRRLPFMISQNKPNSSSSSRNQNTSIRHDDLFSEEAILPSGALGFQQTQVFKAFEGLGTRVDLEEGHRAGLHPHVTAAMLAGMRKLAVVSLLLCFSTLSGWADDAIKGSFVGDWSGSSGGSGTFRLLVEPADGKPKCTVSFTFAGEEVKTNVTLCKTEATRLDAQYDFEMGGTHLQSTIHGELQENTLKGDYQTKSLADGSDVDAGNWKAERQ